MFKRGIHTGLEETEGEQIKKKKNIFEGTIPLTRMCSGFFKGACEVKAGCHVLDFKLLFADNLPYYFCKSYIMQ